MIKKLLLFLLGIFALTIAEAQPVNIPAVVTDSFITRFPNAEAVLWSDKFSLWQVAFKLGTNEMKSTFNSKGYWLKTETRLQFNQLPAAIVDSFKITRYAGIAIKEVFQTEQKGRPLQYTVVTMKGILNKTSLLFSENGHLISEKNFL